jgi:hypothetical protein
VGVATLRDSSAGALQRHHLAQRPLVAHQFGTAISYYVCCRKQNSIRRMHIPRSSRTSLVPNKRRDNRLAETEIRGEAREAVPQHVRRHVRRQSAEFRDSVPELFEAGHDHFTAPPRCRKDQVT